MKIALLNLQFDNNYGGNLQRYALMKVLQDMGHEVTHLYLRATWRCPGIKGLAMRVLQPLYHRQMPRDVFWEYFLRKKFTKRCKVVEPFYNRYVTHTPVIHTIESLKTYQDYDAFIVGSDQVWRKSMNWYLPMKTMFFDWVTNSKAKKIAYAVSMGTDTNELTDKDLEILTPLYRLFNAVSVREMSALNTFKDYGWTMPKAAHTLDPTLLLTSQDYLNLIENGNTHPSEGNMFCYVLDNDAEKQHIIDELAREKGLKPFSLGIDDIASVSVEQWLRSFADAEYIVTDSFHGCVFSIIFNKPFKLMVNPFRGMARFESLLATLKVDTDNPDWELINRMINSERKKSIDFLKSSLGV